LAEGPFRGYIVAVDTFVSVSDLHGDRQDRRAVKAFHTFVMDWKPKRRIFKGDLWDFRALRIGADTDEKTHSMKVDFDAGMKFLEWYRPQVFIRGNHDERLWDAVERDGLMKSGPIADYAAELVGRFDALAASLKIEVLPYNKRRGVWSEGGLKFTHGFDGMEPEKMAAMYGNVLYGHGHSILAAASPSHGDNRVARMTGCLCLLDLEYNRGQTKTLRQQHGWAYGAFLGGKRFAVQSCEVNAGSFSYAEKLKTVKVA
jgi:hypothetical protein